MNTLRWKFLPIFFYILLPHSLSGEEPLVKTAYVYGKKGESLRYLLEKRVGISKKVLNQKSYFAKIRKWNPGVENFLSLEEGERIYIEIPFRSVIKPHEDKSKIKRNNLAKKVKNYRKLASTKKEITLKKDASPFIPKKKKENDWNYSLFYTLSRGSLSDSVIGSNISIVSNQDSPLTLGGGTFKRLNTHFSYSGSFYISKVDGGISEQNEEVTLPLELGINSYVGYKKENWPVEVYSGFDIEKFSSYNADELVVGEGLSSREHTIAYLTAGVSKSFKFLGKRFLTKFSLSKSITSTQSRESILNPVKFSGIKYLGYLNMKYNQNWFYHGLFKRHSLVGATELTITRLGLGVGYSF